MRAYHLYIQVRTLYLLCTYLYACIFTAAHTYRHLSIDAGLQGLQHLVEGVERYLIFEEISGGHGLRVTQSASDKRARFLTGTCVLSIHQ